MGGSFFFYRENGSFVCALLRGYVYEKRNDLLENSRTIGSSSDNHNRIY